MFGVRKSCINRTLGRCRQFSQILHDIHFPRATWNGAKINPPQKLSRGKDAFKWMEKYDSNVRLRLEEEERFCTDVLKSCSTLNEVLLNEIDSFYEEEHTESVPSVIQGYSYYSKQSENDYLPVFYRKAVGTDNEETVLNLNSEFAEGPVTVNNMVVSRDSNYLAYTVDTTGEELYNLFVKDLRTGQVEVIKRNVYSFAFGIGVSANDIYYTVANNLMRTNRIYRHILGTSVTRDELVFEEKSQFYYCDVKRTNDCRFITIHSVSKSSSEIYIQGGICRTPTLLVQRRADEECYIEHIQDYFVIVRNSHNKPFEVFLVSENDAFGHLAWLEGRGKGKGGLLDRCFDQKQYIPLTPTPSPSSSHIIPDSFRIIDMDVMERHLVLYEKSCAGYRIRTLQLDSYDHNISISEQTFDIHHLGDFIIGNNPDPRSHTVQYTLSSPGLRGDTYEYDLSSNTARLIQHLPLPSSSCLYEDSLTMTVECVTSKDGQEIPFTMIRRKDADGSSPVLVSSYGCYGVDVPIRYIPSQLALLKRGWTIGYAAIRGGGDKGPRWYQQGSGLNRENGIRDLDCVVKAVSSKHPVCLSSNSAGGIIVGSLLNQTTTPIQAVLLHVPFLLLRDTLSNRDLPLTVTEFDEWGNPDITVEMQGIKEICPYTNLQKRNYPNIFCTCGLKDKRTPFYNTLKYINRIRQVNMDENTVQVMRCYPEGHFCENDPDLRVISAAEQLSFLIHSVGGDKL